MSRLEEIKQNHAVSVHFNSWQDLLLMSVSVDKHINVVCKEYAKECMANALQLGSYSADMKYHDGRNKEDSEIKYFQNGADNLIVNRESITNPENIVLL